MVDRAAFFADAGLFGAIFLPLGFLVAGVFRFCWVFDSTGIASFLIFFAGGGRLADGTSSWATLFLILGACLVVGACCDESIFDAMVAVAITVLEGALGCVSVSLTIATGYAG